MDLSGRGGLVPDAESDCGVSTMKSRLRISAAAVGLGLVASSHSQVVVRIEHLNPAAPGWKFAKVMRPSRSDAARTATVKIVGNKAEPVGALPSAIVDGLLPSAGDHPDENLFLSNATTKGGKIVLDLGKVISVAAVNSYSWHEFPPDQGARGPQVYTLYGSADSKANPNDLSRWTRLASVDTRPNSDGSSWNGQYGVNISNPNGLLGRFRYLLLDVQATRSPKNGQVEMTNTFFSELDVHTAATLKRAGDASVIRPAKITDLWVVFKTHFDIGYTATIAQVLERYRGPMIDNALAVMDANQSLPPEQRFTWTVPGWPLHAILWPGQPPERRARIVKALKERQLAVHAAAFTLHTESLDLEDLVRSLQFSADIARRNGLPLPRSAKMTDVPEHAWIIPTLFTHAGIRFLQIGCNGASDYPRFPLLFWWEGPDGSRLLTAYTKDYGSGIVPPSDWPAKNYLAMIMTGDNHGPPTAAEVESVRREAAARLPGVRLHFGTLDDFRAAIEKEKPKLPLVRADTPDTWIHGLMSMPVESKIVRNVRPLEPALESLDTHLRAWGVPTGNLAPELAKAYEQSLLFGEHTWGMYGSQPGDFWYGEEWRKALAEGRYKTFLGAFDDKRAYAYNCEGLVSSELYGRMQQLAGAVRAKPGSLVVWNGLPWARSGFASLPGNPQEQVHVKNVPANGYVTVSRSRVTNLLRIGRTPNSDGRLTTRHYRVQFDLKRGGISSLVERATGRELVDFKSPYALGQYLHEQFSQNEVSRWIEDYSRFPAGWAANDFGKPGMPGPDKAPYRATSPGRWSLSVRRSPLGDEAVMVSRDLSGSQGGVRLRFTFSRFSPTVDVEWVIDKKTPNPLPEGGWLCFPFKAESPRFALGRLNGPTDPAKDIVHGAGRYRFAVTTGVSVMDAKGRGVSLCPIDSPLVSLGTPGLWKHDLDYVPRTPTVFVNLYNNMWNTNFPLWQEGTWGERVRIWPHANLARTAWEARVPLLAASVPALQPSTVSRQSVPSLPARNGGLRVSRPGVLVTAFGANPFGSGTLLRIWDQTGSTGIVTVGLPRGMKVSRATPVNLRGEAVGGTFRVRNGRFDLRLRRLAPATFVLR